MARLIVTNKGQGIRYYELRDGEKLSVGRESGNDIVIEESRVSRIHASFFSRGSKFFVTDLFSRNGSIVNGEMLVGDRELCDQDVINIGATVIVIEMEVSLPKREPGEVTATGGFSNTKIAAAQFRSREPFTPLQTDLLMKEVQLRNGHNIFQDPTWALTWWHGSSLSQMAKLTVKSSIEILKTLQPSIPTLNVFVFALSALLEEEEPTWKLNLMGDPIKICEEFNELLKSFPGPIIAESAIVKRVAPEWKFDSIANIRFKSNFPSCELFALNKGSA